MQDRMLTLCSYGCRAFNFPEDSISLPAVPTSQQKVEPDRRISSLCIISLHGFPNSSFIPERQ